MACLGVNKHKIQERLKEPQDYISIKTITTSVDCVMIRLRYE